MQWLNYHHLHYFWVVARQGGITIAAKQLHVTPATLSVQIRDLEKSMGVKLFRKEGRNLMLTEMGESVLEYANEIFAVGNELMEMVGGRPTGSPLVFRVGVKDVVPKLVAYKFLEPAMHLENRVRLVCHEGDMDELVASLCIHRLDVVLSDTPLNPSMKVRAYSHLLGESKVEIMGTSKLIRPLRRGFPASLDLAPMLLPMNNTVLRRSLDVWFRDKNIRPEIRGEFADSAMLKIAAKSGAGLIAVPSIIATEVRTMYTLETLGSIDGIMERFYAISVERKLKHPAVVAISELAKERLVSSI
ncbi:MAG: transcriptional activator NhaR [Pirellulaceae bacterium]|nr:transcriptional activator NhaR [Pirellulaceae bacterium]